MCIVFLYSGCDNDESDYSLILASNRDEFYHRPAKNAAPWAEDENVIGGRDMEAGCEGGTWLAISPLRKRLGLLLNLPGNKKPHAKSRGTIVENFVKSSAAVEDYVESIKDYSKDTNDFIFLTVDFSKPCHTIQSYINVTNQLDCWPTAAPTLSFSNSLPDNPLKKVEAGQRRMQEICSQLNRTSEKDKLVEKLVDFLRWDQRHLPDPELEKRNPAKHEHLSSVFVCIPEVDYGTRTHTIVLVSKTRQAEFIEVTLQHPINPLKPEWKRNYFQFFL